MSILAEQLGVGDKVVSNDIALDPVARSVTMQNGYYVDHMYPNNTTVMTGENPWTGTQTETITTYDVTLASDVQTEVTTTEYVAEGCTAGCIQVL